MGGSCCRVLPCRCQERLQNYMDFHATEQCHGCKIIVNKTFIHQGTCGRCSAQRKMRNSLIDHYQNQLKTQVNCQYLIKKVIFYLNQDLKKDYQTTKELYSIFIK